MSTSTSRILPLLLGLALAGPARAQGTGYLVGAGGDESLGGFDLGPDGVAVAALTSDSPDWPQAGATSLAGGTDLVLAIFDQTNPAHTFYYGGSGDEAARALSVASDGTIWVTGTTTSADLPLLSPLAEGGACSGCGLEIFVARFARDGTLLFATTLGGREDGRDDEPLGIQAVDDGVLVVGKTRSTAFPMRGGHLQGTHGNDVGGNDGFLAHLKEDGAGGMTLTYSTYLGGNRDDALRAVVVSESGRVYLGGWTSSDSATLSLTQAFDDTASAMEGLLLALDPASGGGFELAWSSFLGGLSDDVVRDLAVLPDGLAVVGDSDSSNFAPAARATLSGTPTGLDGFVLRLVDEGSRASIAWWTFAGGQGVDRYLGVSVFPDGQIAVSGATASADLLPVDPVVGNPGGLAGPSDAFFSVYDADGLTLLWSEVAGGAGDERAPNLRVHANPSFTVTVAGNTDSTDFLATSGRTPAGTNTFLLSRPLFDDATPPLLGDLVATFTAEGAGTYQVDASWTASDADTRIVSTLWSVEPVDDLEAETVHGPIEVGTQHSASAGGLALVAGRSYAVEISLRDAAGLETTLNSAPFEAPGGEQPDGGGGDGGDADGGTTDELEPVFGWSCDHVESPAGLALFSIFFLTSVLLRERRS
ncbi:MAG: hypothetical protein P1V51_23145 [Deltaproteobacteria bacterium]|nr:hypothetical protein [Deltaproteobacteria bacterium]